MTLEEAGVGLAREERRVLEDADEEVAVGDRGRRLGAARAPRPAAPAASVRVGAQEISFASIGS